MAGTILVVDDEQDIRELVADVLEDEGYRTVLAATAAETFKKMEKGLPDCVILDVWLQDGDRDGLAILRHISECYPDIPVIMISGHATIETAIHAIRLGAFDFIEKPFKGDHLLHLVRRAFETAKLKQENVSLRQQAFDEERELIGASGAVARLRAAIAKAAPGESRILLYGPPGSGKSVAAHTVHQCSKRAEGPFVVWNTSLLTDDNAEQAIWGAGERSVFERAHGGTLFIEEIAEIPLKIQPALLRILQNGFVEKADGKRVMFSVRVVAGTNRNLQLELRAGRLREDLYHRLNVVSLEVPPLSERMADLDELVRHFMQLCARQHGVPPRKVTPNAMAALAAYSWPGNVRELRNVIERLLIAAPGGSDVPISSSMLPPEILEGTPVSASFDDNGSIVSLPLREAREAFEKNYLSVQIQRFNHNISRTAEFIGMERSALYRKLKMLGLYDGAGKRREEETA
jgi:two-component system nitrogen regulation response regulator NtrX